jgi:hypothetical protein
MLEIRDQTAVILTSLEYCVLGSEKVQFQLMLNYLVAEIKGKQYKEKTSSLNKNTSK